MAELGAPEARGTIEQVVGELAAEFETTPADTIHQLVVGCFAELSEDAKIETYLPVLIKRVVRERLRARSISAA